MKLWRSLLSLSIVLLLGGSSVAQHQRYEEAIELLDQIIAAR